MNSNKWLAERHGQVLLAVSILLTLFWLFHGSSLFIWAPIMLGIVPLVFLMGFANPSLYCLIFYTFCLFRIQDFFPQLDALRIPLIAALLGILSLIYNFAVHQRKFFWKTEMTYFSLFFVQVTLGVLFAYNFDMAFDTWSGGYSKIPIIFFLLAWSLQEKKDFKTLIAVTILCGSIISLMALYNKINGIGLIENTRAAVLPGKTSTLSDPNGLAFLLLIPLSFSCAMFVTKSLPAFVRFLGLNTSIIITIGITVTQSRGGLLGLIGIFIYFLSRRIKSIIPVILIGSIIFVSFYFLAGMEARQTWNGQGMDDSSTSRLYAWGAAINMAAHHPLFGVGLNGFIPNFHGYMIAPTANTQITTHSSWFLVLAESGFAGFYLFMTCICLAIKSTLHTIKRLESLDKKVPEKPFYLAFSYGLFACFIGFCISGSFLSQGYSWNIYILIALATALAYSTEKTFKI